MSTKRDQKSLLRHRGLKTSKRESHGRKGLVLTWLEAREGMMISGLCENDVQVTDHGLDRKVLSKVRNYLVPHGSKLKPAADPTSIIDVTIGHAGNRETHRV